MPFENTVMVADDSGDRLFEINRTTGALVGTIPQSAFAAALPVGGGAPAGAARADAFRGIAYDIVSGDLYVFSGACCGTVGPFFPTAFRLHRDASQQFQVLSYQPLPEGTDPVAATFRAGTGIYFGKGTKIRTYDYATNTIGADIKLTGTGTAIQGIAFDGVGPPRHQHRRSAGEGHDQRLDRRTGLDARARLVRHRRPAVVRAQRRPVPHRRRRRHPCGHRRQPLPARRDQPRTRAAGDRRVHAARDPRPGAARRVVHRPQRPRRHPRVELRRRLHLDPRQPAHTFANPGTYVVTLHVTGVGGVSDASTTITVLPADTLSGGYTLDGFGGLHPFSTGTGASPPITLGAAYWSGWDIARGVATTADGHGGYTLDGYGGLHPFRVGNGAAPPESTDGPYWSGWDAARGVALMPDGSGGLLVDLSGGIHRFRVGASALPPKPVGGPYWAGQDRARGIAILPDGSGGFVVDRDGGLFAFSLGDRLGADRTHRGLGTTGRPGGAGRRARQLGPGRLHARRHRWAPPLHGGREAADRQGVRHVAGLEHRP